MENIIGKHICFRTTVEACKSGYGKGNGEPRAEVVLLNIRQSGVSSILVGASVKESAEECGCEDSSHREQKLHQEPGVRRR